MFFNAEGKPVPIENDYKEQSCFLICSGPSLNKLDLDQLRQPGIVTFGINNSPRIFRPDLWTMVDCVQNFMISIWRDPKIKKFIPLPKTHDTLFDNTRWIESTLKVCDCPNIVYYNRNEHFNAETFLTEDTINWGNHTNNCECGKYVRPSKKESDAKKEPRVRECPICHQNKWGCRSVFLTAIRIIHLLGFRKLFLVGCDFKMSETQKYAWGQDRSRQAIKNNNGTYERLNERMDKLRPIFEKNNFYVWNCTPDSGLKSFDYIDLNLAVRMATKDFPDVLNEKADGMYERRAIEKDKAKKAKVEGTAASERT